ncbi:hypothetical protein CCACVL1_00362 [Corchorus capsularis]|uniref:Uncharacterized protein n=1 Tax=Corchorus capsularis TaxID=210143 RepID=A0A1R3KX47_COCAP|nr:hypothetical protein CCACVL1_00362 [Corchorus capsularis]
MANLTSEVITAPKTQIQSCKTMHHQKTDEIT